METSLEKGWVKVDGPDRSGKMVAVIEHFNLGGSWETLRTGMNMGACNGHSEAQTPALPLPGTDWCVGGGISPPSALLSPSLKWSKHPLRKLVQGPRRPVLSCGQSAGQIL